MFRWNIITLLLGWWYRKSKERGRLVEAQVRQVKSQIDGGFGLLIKQLFLNFSQFKALYTLKRRDCTGNISTNFCFIVWIRAEFKTHGPTELNTLEQCF